MITDPEEIDWYLIINEVDTEIARECAWQGIAENLSERAKALGSELVYVTDCEGEFVCLATRKVAEWMKETLNKVSDSELPK